MRSGEFRPGEFCVAPPVQTLTLEATSQPAQPDNAAVGVRVEYRVPDGSRHGVHNLVCAGPASYPINRVADGGAGTNPKHRVRELMKELTRSRSVIPRLRQSGHLAFVQRTLSRNYSCFPLGSSCFTEPSQTLIVPSTLLLAIRVPSGLNATPQTVVLCPVRVRVSCPVCASQTFSVSS